MKLLMAGFLSGLVSISSASLAQDQTIPWGGKVIKRGPSSILSPSYILSGDGAVLRGSNRVVTERDGKYTVRVGGQLRVLKAPRAIGVQKNDLACPHNGRTFCAGLVETCCGSGKVLRACLGVRGC